jgi:arylsulfatase A-like enzyme
MPEMMKSLDDNIGRVLARLAELGFERDTIVVFTSDNGGERFSDTWPFTGKKTELLEGGLRIPAIVRWPGMVSPGSRSTVPFMSMDWLPTFVAAGGGQQSAAFPSDGVDIWPALAGGTLPERTLFWRYGNKQQRAARRGRPQVPQDQRQRVPVRRRCRSARARQPQGPASPSCLPS